METSGLPQPGEALRRAASVLNGNGSTSEDPVLAGLNRERQARYGGGILTIKDQESDTNQELNLRFDGRSILGINHQSNEDHIAVMPDQSLAMVFDGVGGLAYGDKASNLVRQIVADRLGRMPTTTDVDSVKREMNDSLMEASSRLLTEVPGSGTTAVVAKFIENAGQRQVIIGSVGDSRAYILREGNLMQVSEDDSALSASGLPLDEQKRISQKLDQVSSDQDLANLTDQERGYWHNRNAITQMLREKDNPPVPHIYQITLKEGDKVILTSDGVHDNLTDSEIREILMSGSGDLSLALAERARDRSGENHVRSKPDDISAVVIDVESRSGVIKPEIPQATIEEEQSEEPKRAWFQNVVSGVRDNLHLPQWAKDRFNGEAVKKVARESWERATNIRVLGQSVVDVATGGAIGFGARTAIRTALIGAGASGFVPLAVGGAVGGMAVETYKRIRKEHIEYGKYSNQLREELNQLIGEGFGHEHAANLVKKYQELELQRNEAESWKSRELLSDQLRYIGVFIKRSEKGKEVDGKALLDAYFESDSSTIAKDQTEADQLLKALKETKLVDRKKLVWAIGRGAVFGAAGGVVGAEVADWFAHNVAPNINEETPVIGGMSKAAQEVYKFGADKIGQVLPQPTTDLSTPPLEQAGQADIMPSQPSAAAAEHLGTMESTKIPGGVDSLKFTNDAITQELTKKLGRVPTNKELVSALVRVIADSKIEDVTGIPEGTQLNLTGLNDIVDVSKGLQPDISPSIAARPEIIPLPKGSNGWEIAERLVKEAGGKGTFDEIKAVDYAISKASGVGVPSWDLPGQIDHTRLPVGFEFHENTDVKVLLTQIQDGNFQPGGATVAADVGVTRVVNAPIPIRPEVSVPEEAPVVVAPAPEVIPAPQPVETPPVPKPPDIVGGLDTSLYSFTDPSSRVDQIYIGPNLKTTLLEQVTNDLKTLYPGAPPEVTNRLANQLAYSSNLALNPTDQLPTGAKIARDKIYKNLLLSMLPKDTSFITHTGIETVVFDKASPTSFWREAAKMAGRALGRIANEDEIMLVAKALQKSSNPAAEINERFFGPLRVDDKVREVLKIITGNVAKRMAA